MWNKFLSAKYKNIYISRLVFSILVFVGFIFIPYLIGSITTKENDTIILKILIWFIGLLLSLSTILLCLLLTSLGIIYYHFLTKREL